MLKRPPFPTLNMSSETSLKDCTHFSWNSGLDRDDYVLVRYYIETLLDIDAAAFGMAAEQSLCTVTPALEQGTFAPPDWSARVYLAKSLGTSADPLYPTYRLNTPVYNGDYAESPCRYNCAEVILAYPCRLFGTSIMRLLAVCIGEVHRLGYLSAVRVMGMEASEAWRACFRGPRYGVGGLREKVGVYGRPLLGRSCRPAVGLDLPGMVETQFRALAGGFDLSKDDELTFHTDLRAAEQRIRAMVDMKRRAEDLTGERKLYFTVAIDDRDEALRVADVAQRLGADGVLVAASLQGWDLLRALRERTDLLLLAHNTAEDAWTRHPRCGVSPAFVAQIYRMTGADLAFLPAHVGAAESSCEESCEPEVEALRGPDDVHRPVLPILAGGKRPGDVAVCREVVGSNDFLLIVATAVDEHPDGAEAGARAFRAVCEEECRPCPSKG
jgi:ribulose 1,5-bisphosphate carboxylase large subunit-like protein